MRPYNNAQKTYIPACKVSADVLRCPDIFKAIADTLGSIGSTWVNLGQMDYLCPKSSRVKVVVEM